MQVAFQVLILVIGFVMLIKGADWFVEGASKIADKFGIPQLVIGLTIVAFGTSAPEAAISVTAALKGNAGITIGNILGSNILNILLILGITAIIIPLKVQVSTLRYEVPFVIAITSLLYFLGIDGVINFLDGVILWVLFIFFLAYLARMAKKGENILEEAPKADASDKWPQIILMTVVGILLIVIGSDVTVDSATEIARIFGISERIIGLTIVAFGTSLPELITSVTAGIKGKADIAVGNIVGSNIFNILFVVGTAGLITPVTYSLNFLVDSLVCVGAALLLFLCLLKGRKLNRSGGVLLLAGYVAYFVYLLV